MMTLPLRHHRVLQKGRVIWGFTWCKCQTGWKHANKKHPRLLLVAYLLQYFTLCLFTHGKHTAPSRIIGNLNLSKACYENNTLSLCLSVFHSKYWQESTLLLKCKYSEKRIISLDHTIAQCKNCTIPNWAYWNLQKSYYEQKTISDLWEVFNTYFFSCHIPCRSRSVHLLLWGS